MFFGLSFQFRVILEEFDAQDGLRKLYNVVRTQTNELLRAIKQLICNVVD